MEVLQFPARQSSGSPAKEGWVRGELSGVMTLAFEAIADSILSQPLEGGAEACEGRISAVLFFALGRNGFPRLIRSEWDKISHALPDLLERSLFVGDFSFPAGV